MMLDKFYTSPEASQAFVGMVNKYVDLSYFNNIIEPSAGSGRLLEHLPDTTIALDLLPEKEGITQMDFFDYEYPEGKNITVMNPPFGRGSKLAIEFFNKAADHCEVIACIIPVTWEKYSIHKRLKENWHLVISERMPEASFTANGKPYRVRCVQQLWVRADKNEDEYEGFKKVQ